MNTNINWKERIEDYRSSGLSLDKWCDANNVSKAAMGYHLYGKKYREKCRKIKNESSDICTSLVPVQIVDYDDTSDSDDISINVNGATIKVDYSTDMKLLRKIVEALQ